jgi:hypothetical protein
MNTAITTCLLFGLLCATASAQATNLSPKPFEGQEGNGVQSSPPALDYLGNENQKQAASNGFTEKKTPRFIFQTYVLAPVAAACAIFALAMTAIVVKKYRNSNNTVNVGRSTVTVSQDRWLSPTDADNRGSVL